MSNNETGTTQLLSQSNQELDVISSTIANDTKELAKKLEDGDIELDIYEITGIFARAKQYVAKYKSDTAPNNSSNQPADTAQQNTGTKNPEEKVTDILKTVKNVEPGALLKEKMEEKMEEKDALLKDIFEDINKLHEGARFKSIICALFQIIGIVMILKQQVNDISGTDGMSWCRMDSNISYKILTTLLQLYLLSFAVTSYLTNKSKSLDCIKSHFFRYFYKEDTLKEYKKSNENLFNKAYKVYDPYWITAGFDINSILYFMVSFTSAFLIYSEDDPVDLVLNCVALFFLTEMDDLLVGERDVEKVQKIMEWYKDNDYKILKTYGENITKVNPVFDWCNGVVSDISNIIEPVSFGSWILLPLWNAICT